MQTSKAKRSPEHQTTAIPVTKAAAKPMPPALSQPSLSLASRPAVPLLFLSDSEAGVQHQSNNAEQSISPRASKGDLPISFDERKSQKARPAAASTAASGTKRTRDGKDGPARKTSKADKHEKPKLVGESLANDDEERNPHDARSNVQPPGKRARKNTVTTQSGQAHRPKPVDQGTSQTEALSPAAKISSAPTQLPENALSGPAPASPLAWKHGAQSPRAHSGSRASLTLSPRRSSNASATERVSPARQGENMMLDQQAKANSSASATLPENEAFTFSPCDSDEEGVIRVDSGSGSTLAGQTARVAPLAVPSVTNPGSAPGNELDTKPKGGAAPGQQLGQEQPGLAPDLTALLDDLDAALDNPIGM